MSDKRTKVAVSGALGRLGSSIAEGVARADGMELTGAWSPGHAGESVAGVRVAGSMKEVAADLIVECTHPDVVMENLKQWHSMGRRAVVGTSGFTADRIEEVKAFWGQGDPGCLIVPNFSIGAALMMFLAEMALPISTPRKSSNVTRKRNPMRNRGARSSGLQCSCSLAAIEGPAF